ncbi:MAG: class I SAM-dependent methyltransferase [Candidatus Gracilibacteria bacterium]
MKSKFVKKFNHDSIAVEYDEDVKNENNPIRTGYSSLLLWVNTKTQGSEKIIDLGCGTGNTVNSLSGNFSKIICVDISENMINIAKEKLKKRENIFFIKNDLLQFFDEYKENDIDTIVSTYAIHHLTQDEKHKLFEKIYNFLPKGGKIIFGDLMFKNRGYEYDMRLKYPNLIEDFDDELYWYLDDELNELKKLGFNVEIKQFSDLSFGIYGEK